MQSPWQATKLAGFLSCAEWSFQKLLTNLVLNRQIDNTLTCSCLDLVLRMDEQAVVADDGGEH